MSQLDEIRSDIDQLDEQIIDLLAQRKNLIAKVIEFKKANNIASLQPKRRDQVSANWRRLAEAKGLDAEVAESVWTRLHEYFLKLEEKSLDQK